MEYRKLGRTGLDVSAIGLGTEHLEQSRKAMKSVLDAAVDAGVNYIDLLPYDPKRSPDYWDNFAPALKRHRSKLILAVHWAPPNFKHPAAAERCLNDVLAHLGNDYAEVAIIQLIDSKKQWDRWGRKSAECLQFYKEVGKIGYIGMSGHTASTATGAVSSGLIDVLMFPINMIQHSEEESKALCRTCVEQNVGLVAMKPYHGGTLLFTGGKLTGITPSQCLAYVLSQPVSTTVPGIKNAEELRATLHYLKATDAEKDYSQIKDIHCYLAGQCVYCEHCHPCPQRINIARTVWLVDQTQEGITRELRSAYHKRRTKASECTECGVCMERCPFDVDIISKMRKAVEFFETGSR